MSRGVFYSKREDELLLRLCDDMKGEKLIIIARKAKWLGICEERGDEALAQHIGQLLAPADKEESNDGEGYDAISDDGLRIQILEKRLNEIEQKYNAIVFAALHNAGLWAPDQTNLNLKLDVRAIWQFLYENEPELINAKFEQLKEAEVN